MYQELCQILKKQWYVNVGLVLALKPLKPDPKGKGSEVKALSLDQRWPTIPFLLPLLQLEVDG